ncbi:MAG: phage protein NinX family protein [Rahnella inusitata]|jgi:hypothetical protein
MKDYSAMDDSSINMLVGESFGLVSYFINNDSSVQFRNPKGYFNGTKNYCNNPADAWPIIDENNISIINDHPELRIATSSVNSLMNEIDSDCYFQAANENGIRAAMEVYLMMKYAEKDHG